MIQEEQQSHQQAQQMQSSQQVPQPQQPQAPLLEEDSSGIDILEWVFRIIDHWYLFVIAAIIAFSLAYLKNRKVMETYRSVLAQTSDANADNQYQKLVASLSKCINTSSVSF